MMRACNVLLITRFVGIVLVAGALASASQSAQRSDPTTTDKPGPQESGLNHRAEVSGAPKESGDSTAPYPLTPRQCQCQAAANATIANLLDREREDQSQKQGFHLGLCNQRNARTAALKEEILGDAAAEVRNQMASSALEAYFRLVETEARSELAERAAAVLADGVARIDKMKAQGVKAPPELEAFERKQRELQSDRAQLRLAQVRLQSQLKSLLGPEINHPERVSRPVLDKDFSITLADSKSEVARGLATRPELRMWRSLEQSLDSGTLPVAQSALQSVNPLAGNALGKSTHAGCPGLKKLLELCKRGCDADGVRQQIASYEAEREQQIASDIDRDVRMLAIQVEILKLARSRAVDDQRHVDQIVDREAKGIASFAEAAEARLQSLRARGTVVEAAATLLIYHAKLRQDQGLLAQECGFGTDAACPNP